MAVIRSTGDFEVDQTLIRAGHTVVVASNEEWLVAIFRTEYLPEGDLDDGALYGDLYTLQVAYTPPSPRVDDVFAWDRRLWVWPVLSLPSLTRRLSGRE